LTRRESLVASLYGEHTARALAARFSTTPGAIRVMAHRARRKCPRFRSTRQPCGRVVCASQIGSVDRPLSLDSL
jgi:hypothetical protein